LPRKTTERGYGSEHQKARRAALAELVPGEPCPFCGQPMLACMKLDFDHSTPLVFGGDGPRRLAHASCNRRAGVRLGNRLRSARRRQRLHPGQTALPSEQLALPLYTSQRW
jgi:hypothetical protein